MNRRCGRFVRFAMALVAVLAVSSCATKVEGATPLEVTHKIKIGVLPIVGASPAFLAKDSGFFADEKLDVEFVTIQSGGTALPSLASGELDIVFGNYVSFFAGQAEGAGAFKFIADAYYAKARTWMVMVPRDSQLKRTADLGGKRVAVTIENGISGLIVKSALDAAGGSTAPPQFVEMPYPDMGVALEDKTVDAALLAEPFITEVGMRFGAFPLVDVSSGPTADFPVAGYAVTDAFAAQNRDVIGAFQRALSRGVSIANTDRGQVERVVKQYAEVDEPTAALMPFVGFSARLDPRRLQRVPDLMVRFGMLPQSINAETMILRK